MGRSGVIVLSRTRLAATIIPAAILSLLSATPGAAMANAPVEHQQASDRGQSTADMRSRLAEAVERVRVAEQHGKFPAARSMAVRRQLDQAQVELARLSRRPEGIGADKLASYDRLVRRIDAELSADANRPAQRISFNPATMQDPASKASNACRLVDTSLRVPPSGKCPPAS
jgi:hypothetical protein